MGIVPNPAPAAIPHDGPCTPSCGVRCAKRLLRVSDLFADERELIRHKIIWQEEAINYGKHELSAQITPQHPTLETLLATTAETEIERSALADAFVNHEQFRSIVHKIVLRRLWRWSRVDDVTDIEWSLMSHFVSRGGVQWVLQAAQADPEAAMKVLGRRLRDELRHLLPFEYGPQIHRPSRRSPVRHLHGENLNAVVDHREASQTSCDKAIQQETHARLWNAVSKLSPFVQQVFTLRYRHNFSHRKIASVLHCKVHRVRMALLTGLEQLRREMGSV